MNGKAKSLLVLATLSGLAIHVINRIEYSQANSKGNVSHVENRYYEWRFGKIKYTKKGKGTPLLLLHDLTPGSSSYEFHKIENSLANKYEVYSLDFLGYGLSDKPDLTFTNYLYVQMVTDFIKNIIGRKTDIIATGDAFPIAVMTCHNNNDTIRNLITINPQNLYQLNQIPSKQTKTIKLILDTPVIGTFLYNIHTSKSAFTKLFREKYYDNPYAIDETDIDTYVKFAHIPDYHSKHAYASYIGKYTNANILHALKEINNSIYIIAGESKEDNKNIVDNYIYYNSAIEVTYIPKTKQLPHMEKPEEVLNCLDLYL